MSISIRSLKCPECSANLEVEDGRKKLFCSYCGSQIIITNENEHIYRYIDEAGIVQAETQKTVRMRELDIVEKAGLSNRWTMNTLTTIWLVISLVILFLGIGIMLFAGDMGPIYGFDFLAFVGGPIIGGGGYLIFKLIPEKDKEKELKMNGGVRFPKSLEPFSEKNYESIYNALTSAGFTNITCINMHDLTLGILTKPGKVQSVAVDGKELTSGGKIYLPDTPITITYHGK